MNMHVRLVLLFPPRLEDALTEAIVAGAGVPGFTLLHAEGHGSDFSRASAAEKVRGRVQRRVLWMLLPQEQVESVLNLLRQQVDGHEVRWWVEPVLAVGKLG
ncbi:DUF3240 family protein [Thermomonas sp.]|uniref:DUF3240 family protein n=1 Tax=Thermomonas sp. TaxID=1971895 RepID=UPI002606AE49|nr:DUF3240 family protein [Thermomonas sp.]MCO5056078.1 DUF3240 family protein [Thermomonas sp.]HRO62679.1 DUF3240 family protein [Thermomonas sp.]